MIEAAELPKTREEALSLGAIHYFTGQPCIHGHVAPRYSKSSKCTECFAILMRSEKRRARRREQRKTPKAREQDRQYKRKLRESEDYLRKEREYDRVRRSRPDHKEYRRRYEQMLRENSPEYRLRHSVGRALSKALLDGKGGSATFDIVGYSAEELKAHLERNFTTGMTWGNYGDWHIDHIIPVSAFNIETVDDMDFKRCWALANLQPMWASQNMSKGAKLTESFQPSLPLRISNSVMATE